MSKEPIHSGHFMTSNPHLELQIEDEDEDVEVFFLINIFTYPFFLSC